MKKNLYLVLFLSLGLFFVINPSSTKRDSQHKVITSKKQNIKKQGRTPASIPTLTPTKKRIATTTPIQREFKGDYQEGNPLKILNKVNPEWKDIYTKNFLRNIPENQQAKDLVIKHHKSFVQVKNGIGKNVEHIIVSYTRPDGKPFAFEALVDSETGSMIQSWNKTRYEFKEPLTFDMRGREFRTK